MVILSSSISAFKQVLSVISFSKIIFAIGAARSFSKDFLIGRAPYFGSKLFLARKSMTSLLTSSWILLSFRRDSSFLSCNLVIFIFSRLKFRKTIISSRRFMNSGLK